MKKFLIKNFVSILVLVALLVIILQRCGSNKTSQAKPVNDTTTQIVYHYIKDTGKSKPIYIKGERDTITESSVEYIPSQDYEELKEQFQELKEELLAKVVMKDKIVIDSVGTIDITDTLQKNRITGRGFVSNIKIPEKTITIIKPAPLKNKWFFGGGIGGNQITLVHDLNVGLALINKKDQLFEVKGRVDLRGNTYAEVNSFWKIKLHK